MKDPTIHNKVWDEIISHNPKEPRTFNICGDEINVCHNKTCHEVEPSRHLTIHVAAKILPCEAISIKTQSSQGTIGRPLSPPYLDHKRL
jgi:hypothetical protein